MKRLLMINLIMMSVSMHASADDANASEQVEAASGQSSSQVQQGENKTLRLKFISRRAYTSRVVKEGGGETANDSHVREKSEASRRLNRRFVSRRSHINYQFH